MKHSNEERRPWVVAAEQFRRADFRPGDLVSVEWLCAKMNLVPPAEWKGNKYDILRRKFRRYRSRFVLFLLRHKGMAFDVVPSWHDSSDGLRFVGRLHSLQHLLRAVKQIRRKIRSGINLGAKIVSNTNRSELDAYSTKEQDQVLCEFARLDGLLLDLSELRKRIGNDLRRARQEWGSAFVERLEELAAFYERLLGRP